MHERFFVLLTAFLKQSARNKCLLWEKIGDFYAKKMSCQNFMLWSVCLSFSPPVRMIRVTVCEL